LIHNIETGSIKQAIKRNRCPNLQSNAVCHLQKIQERASSQRLRGPRSSSQVTQNPPNTRPLQIAGSLRQASDRSDQNHEPPNSMAAHSRRVGTLHTSKCTRKRCIRNDWSSAATSLHAAYWPGRMSATNVGQDGLRLQRPAWAAWHSSSKRASYESDRRKSTCLSCKCTEESRTSFVGKGKVERCMASLPNVCAEPLPASDNLVSSSSHAMIA
jgi:hypothetical protein